MKKYKIEFKETITYCIDVLANDEATAITEATRQLSSEKANGTAHYYVTEELDTYIHAYDVTNTDDPFSPANEDIKTEDIPY